MAVVDCQSEFDRFDCLLVGRSKKRLLIRCRLLGLFGPLQNDGNFHRNSGRECLSFLIEGDPSGSPP
jgi:hypothetical protein